MSNILLIEDQEDIRELVKVMSDVHGYKLTMAQTPQHGVDLCEDGFDLILIDIMMPGMDGHQVLKKLKEEKSLPPKTKCVAFTAKSSGEELGTLVQRGFDGYIIKPFTLSEFKQNIDRFLKN